MCHDPQKVYDQVHDGLQDIMNGVHKLLSVPLIGGCTHALTIFGGAALLFENPSKILAEIIESYSDAHEVTKKPLDLDKQFAEINTLTDMLPSVEFLDLGSLNS